MSYYKLRPYASEHFINEVKGFLNSQNEIKAATENDVEKKYVVQAGETAYIASDTNEKLEGEIFDYLDTVIRNGFKPENKLGDEIESKLVKIGADHSKGLIMNFLRDFIYENNFSELAPEKKFTDSSDSKLSSTSISITGNHTKVINSDTIVEHKKGTSIYGLVADGVTYCSTPVDLERLSKLGSQLDEAMKKYETESGKLEEIESDPESDPDFEKSDAQYAIVEEHREICQQIEDSINFLKETLKEANQDSYSGYYASKAISKVISDFKLPQEFLDCKEKYPASNDERLAQQALVENPVEFWNSLDLKDTEDRSKIIEAIIEKYPMFKEEVFRKFMLAVLPLANQNLQPALKDFVSNYTEKDKGISGSSHLSYAIDLGDDIALVRLGDSPIEAFDKNGKRIRGIDNFSYTNPENPLKVSKLNELRSEVNFSIDHRKEEGDKEKVKIEGSPVIELVKKDQIAYIAIASDGVAQKNDFPFFINRNLPFQQSPSPKAIIQNYLNTRETYSDVDDDKSLLIIKKEEN